MHFCELREQQNRTSIRNQGYRFKKVLKPGISALPAAGFAGSSHIDHKHHV